MKNKLTLILMALSLFILSAPARALEDEPGEAVSGANTKPTSAQAETLADEPDDAISRLKLRPGSMPEDMEILREVRATREQLNQKQKKIGFRLTALLSQTIACGGNQARINYMILPQRRNVDLGYSKLVAREGLRSMLLKKDGVLLQMVADTGELEDRIIFLLKIDPLQASKIRFHRSPQNWKLLNEKFLKANELKQIEQKTGVKIQQGILQDMVVNRTSVKIRYYDCGTERLADRVGESLVGRMGSIEKRTVRGYGSIIVTVDSSSNRVNETVLSYVN